MRGVVPQENRMFKISDIEFEVKNATLDAYIDSDEKLIKWGVEVSAFTISNEFKRWRPSMKSEVFMATKPNDMKSYLDLSGKSVNWNDKEDEDGEPFGELYVFEHEPLYECNIQLTEIEDSLFFSLSSKCDVYCVGPPSAALQVPSLRSCVMNERLRSLLLY
ncbi:hypothetical protein [Desulfoluna spongiiphila]|uniref:hypothetical protein n=1 Tax=Desulfoluna spongiiphila TaxID=419481 RepID=UPI00125FAAD7|nr:hypothetical protein [Desulfoluna spongiiphila]